MKILSLIRHAKSDWSSGATGDHARPLNDRGRRDAPEMGRRLRKRGLVFDRVITSDARRALETIEAIRSEMKDAGGLLEVEPELYLVGAEKMLEMIIEQPATIGHLCLVGHNPGMSVLAQAFGANLDDLPTCAVVTLEFEDLENWNEISESRVSGRAIDRPKVKWEG